MKSGFEVIWNTVFSLFSATDFEKDVSKYFNDSIKKKFPNKFERQKRL